MSWPVGWRRTGHRISGGAELRETADARASRIEREARALCRWLARRAELDKRCIGCRYDSGSSICLICGFPPIQPDADTS